ncbi:hypothetical protein Ahia01_001214800 [Argonauta hians]
MEPYKIKVFYPVNVISRAERLNLLKEAHYNPFLVKAKYIFIDLLTDSGTGSQSSAQWSAMANAGHSTINSKYVKDFEKTIKHITNFKYVFPVHQGRGAEELVAKLLLKKDSIVLSNSLFDTTRAHVESTGAIGIDLVASNTKFKGDVDTGKFKEHLEKYGSRVHLVIVTCTNNVVAGAPVSMQNIEEITKLCRDRKIPVFIDACRFVENAYFIKIMDEKYSKCTILHIVQEMFSHFDGSTMSLKKDGISNEGGFLAFNDDKWGQEIFDIVEYKSGYSTYGGITGMNLAACTVGISEAMNENYLRSRIHQAKLLADFLEDNNIPIFKPVGAHAVYVKANEVLPHLEFLKYSAWSLACAVYIEGGIRTSEIGNVISEFMEPFKIHIVENIKFNSRRHRQHALAKTGFNIFKLHPEDVMIDFLTDAGTNALSLEQNSKLWIGDESYAGSSSYESLKDNAKYITGFEHVLPVFSKRLSEKILSSYYIKPGTKVIANTFTYTLQSHLIELGAEPISLVDWSDKRFGGNLDITALKNTLEGQDAGDISLVIMNVPSKNLGGQPVSIENMKAVSNLCRKHSIPVYIESSMYGENCWRCKMFEESCFNKSLVEISQEMFSLFDGCIISAKRDGRSEIGSVICLRDEEMAQKLGTIITLKAGFITYGGMAGRDMEMVSIGLRSALDEHLLEYRQKQMEFFERSLKKFNVPIVEPVGCNTIFIDAGKAFPNLKEELYPAWSLACATYIVAGIRCAEFGQITHPSRILPDNHPLTGRELIKLEIPRFIYTTCHLLYVAYVFSQLIKYEDICGMKLVSSPECKIKHIKTKMEPCHHVDYKGFHLLPVENCDHIHFFKDI